MILIKAPIIIGIAGGTGSGKSTFTNRICDTFKDEISIIYHDNYYKRQDYLSLDERKLTNYDHPDALDTDLLIEHLNLLKQGKSIECPVYDYSQHNRTDQTIPVHPQRLILVEGILILQDKRLRDLFDIKIYIEADSDERILRRILRDTKERGRDLENIIEQYLTTVKPMHYQYVAPTKAFADVVLNSGLNDVAFQIICSNIHSILDQKN